jgi:hypothetical protein
MKSKKRIANLEQQVAELKAALENLKPTITVEVTVRKPEPDYHSPEALLELMRRMENREVTYGELRKIFWNLETLVGWLNAFTYAGALNGCMLDQDDLPEDRWVWDGGFEKRGEELWYTGCAGASGYGNAEAHVKEDDLIVLF